MKAAIVAFAISLTATPALAWEKIVQEDGSCAFGQTFDGPGSTMIIFVQDKESFDQDTISDMIRNKNWSIKGGEKLAGAIRFTDITDGAWFGDGQIVAVDNGLVMLMKAEHVRTFFDDYPIAVQVTRAGKVIDRLDFKDSFAVWMSFKDCVRPWEREKQERDRLNAINKLPKDPFAD